MENLERYGFNVSSPTCCFGKLENGPYVLFSDVAEALKPSHNKKSTPCHAEKFDCPCCGTEMELLNDRAFTSMYECPKVGCENRKSIDYLIGYSHGRFLQAKKNGQSAPCECADAVKSIEWPRCPRCGRELSRHGTSSEVDL